jgi:transposase
MMECALDIGVDVSKDTVEVACARGSFRTHSIANRHKELRAWVQSLPAASRIGVESTGEYHELLAELATAQGLKVFVLNPRDLRHYAKAVGLRAKTDRVDAALIARYVANEHRRLFAWVAPTAEQRRIQRLLTRRALITRMRAALSQSLKSETALGTELRATRRQFDAMLKKLDAKLLKLVGASAQRKSTYARITTIYGFGPLLGAYLSALFERIKFANANAFIAFIGLDPRANDSGKKIGRRRLSKRGPGELRRLLFLAAMNYVKTKHGAALYERLRERGLATTAALNVVARKLARIAYALDKHGANFDIEKLSHA